MTYCVGLLLDEGIVALSDTRTNAGVDNIAVYRKMFCFDVPGERAMVVMTAGNLSVTQTTLGRLEHSMESPETAEGRCILRAASMLDVAEIVGRTMHEVSTEIGGRLGQRVSAAMLLGGQRKGGDMRLFLIYPEGNFIEATEDTPYLQVGEHKYGKPILDRVVTRQTTLDDGRKAVLLSMDSTLRSNLSVGMPLDLAMIRRDAFRIDGRERIEPDDAAFKALSDAWGQALRDAFVNMP